MTSLAIDKRRQTEFVMATLDKYERPLTRYAMRLLSGDLSAAQDVVQHAFMKLCEIDYRTVENRAAPWLYRVCRNRAIDLIRGRNSEEQLDQPDIIRPSENGHSQLGDPAEIVEEADFFDNLRGLIDELPDSQREVVELWSQGFSSKEVADVIGKKAGAVRITMHRAIKQLRRHESVKRWLNEMNEVDSDIDCAKDSELGGRGSVRAANAAFLPTARTEPRPP